MADIQPFRAYRPRPELAAKVASPPYDVLDSNEAREMARDEPLSFLHVIKPEIDLPPGTDPHTPEVYAKGAERLRMLVKEGALIRDPEPCLYAYQQQMDEHVQVGLVAGASVKDYDLDKIRKHEHTRPEKEDDRTRHIEILDANTGPVFLTYRHRAPVDAKIDAVRAGTPTYDFTAPDGVRHTLWVIADEESIRAMQEEFTRVDVLYVADGHHRAASASRVAVARRRANPRHTGSEPYDHFLSVLFPDDQVRILEYNRVVADLADLNEESFLERVKGAFGVEPTEEPKPRHPRQFGMRLRDRWFRLVAREGSFPADDPVDSLDAAILQNGLLAPILGIEDPRVDARIDFVGGIRGIEELEGRVAHGAAVAFALYPTSVAQLMAIADAGRVMPPKSTWFEPKLRSGLIVRPLSDRLGGDG